MKKCLIICWYGQLPYYYKLWERSSALNKDFDFLIFTDQKIKTTNQNIIVVNKTMEEMSKIFSEKLGMNVNIKKHINFVIIDQRME